MVTDLRGVVRNPRHSWLLSEFRSFWATRDPLKEWGGELRGVSMCMCISPARLSVLGYEVWATTTQPMRSFLTDRTNLTIILF